MTSALLSITVATYTAVALATSPEVRSAEDAWKAADSALKGQAAAMLLPTLAFTYTEYPYGHSPLDSYRWKRGDYALRHGQAVTVANWNLFNSFEDVQKTRNAVAARRAAASALKAARQDRAYAAISAFYDLNSKKQLYAVAEQNLSDQKKQFDQSRDLYEHGMKSLADLLKSETDWLSSQLRLASANAERRKALADFNILVDRSPGAEAELDVDLQPGATGLPLLDADLARALEIRPEVVRARDQLARAEVDAQRAIKGLLPDVKVDASWTRTRYADFPGAGSSIPNPNRQVGLTVSLPLGFNGFTQGWALAAARADLRRARTAVDAAERAVRADIYGAHVALERVLTSYAIAVRKEEIAARALELVGRQFQQGAADAIRMNQAQADLLNARVERTLALHDIFINRAQYRRAVGDPLW
ncbi:MAG: TolC family protein [Elusimicrobiota bacterium]|nr:MAG: TolC family protein [Elusimicrobiota bacterium]